MNIKKMLMALFATLFMANNPLSAQNSDAYDPLWKKVDSLASLGLPESAMKIVAEIRQRADTEENSDQIIKACIYRLKFFSFKEEDAVAKLIEELELEVQTAKFPTKPILESLIGQIYWGYYERNQYKIQGRTQTDDFNKKDIRTWTIKDIISQSFFHFQKSLENEKALKETNLALLHEVLGYQSKSKNEKIKVERKLRPTLFDFLAYNAINHLLTHQLYGFPTGKNPFALSDDKYLASPEEFAKMKINTEDSLSNNFFIISTYQKLTQLHLSDNDPSALVHLSFLRLNFIKEKGVFTNKDQKYFEALEILANKYPENPETAIVFHAIASVHYANAGKYANSRAETHRWLYKKALDICENTAKKFPNTVGSENCLALKSEILAKNLTVIAEEVISPDVPFLANIAYRNVKKSFVKIVEITNSDLTAYENADYDKKPKIIESWAKRIAVQTQEVALPQSENDMQAHRLDIALKPMKIGRYVLFAHDENLFDRFDYKNQSIFYSFLRVSALSPHVITDAKNGGWEFRVLHRQTGKALENVKITVTARWYNYKSGNYKSAVVATKMSDANGFAFVNDVPKQQEEYYPSYEFSYELGEDKIKDGQGSGFQAKNQNGIQEAQQFYLFTDRAIYRPGQTIFFKGIFLKTDSKNAQVIENQKIEVQFFDVNYQVIATQSLKTNEFGAIDGNFTAPKSGLNGQMRLIAKFNEYGSGEAYVRVEEYKRPKFEVNFEPLKTAYRLKDKVEVTAKAKAYSGASIDGADVSFRVIRKAKYAPWRWRWYGGGGENSPQAEIHQGKTKTDENGNFTVSFEAIPDPNSDKNVSYEFEVLADVTDINGETRSGSTSVNLGHEAITLSTDLEDEVRAKDGSVKVVISAQNLDGKAENTKGKYILTQLVTPKLALQNRKFETPDVFVLSKDEFKKLFPYEVYEKENQKPFWEKGKKIIEAEFNTETSKDILLKNLSAGVYFLQMECADRFGTLVKYENYFTVFDEKNTALPYPVDVSFSAEKYKLEPTETINLQIASGMDNINALVEIFRDGKKILAKNVVLNADAQKISYLVTEEDRGGLAAKVSFVKNNRFYQEGLVFDIPFSNKELNVSFETFRDKLQPGEKEQWKVKISGPKSDKVAAEMLATLYDASLDVFAKNQFNFSPYAYNSGAADWDAYAFGNVSTNITRDWNLHYYPNKGYNYELFNWFGYSVSYFGYYYNNEYIYALQGRASGVALSSAPMMEGGKREMKKHKSRSKDKESTKSADSAGFSEEEMALGFAEDAEEADAKIAAKPEPTTEPEPVKIRTNFNETAFFKPDLRTDEEGNVYVNFTIPESLTKWKLLGLAHTKDAKYAVFQKELVTQKTLMVVPNSPRFFREGDKIVFSAKVTNLSSTMLEGFAKLQLLDAFSGKPVVEWNDSEVAQKFEGAEKFKVEAGQSTVVKWRFTIPQKAQAITYRIYANAGGFSDGEEMTLPVLTNRMLVTETMPLPTRGGKKESFSFKKMTENKSKTLVHHKLTLEFTSAPAWYAVQALPYLMEYPYECSEQVFSRYYANVLASYIVNASPKIKAVFETWKNTNSVELLSKLEQNQALKSAILEETPWVMEAAGETQRKKNVALLFDLTKMSQELGNALTKLEKKQHGNGGFSWFENMPASWYITQHILNGLGHLSYMGVIAQSEQKEKAQEIARKALNYCDEQIADEYENLLKEEKRGFLKMSDDHLSHLAVHYLYARSFYLTAKKSSRVEKAYQYFLGQAEKYWLKRALSGQAMLALALHRNEKTKTANDITKSLKERSLNSPEMGRYWKEMTQQSYWWYDAPIETMALLIEAFSEINKDVEMVDDMKTWLLKNKQTNAWATTKATTEAVYALFLNPEKMQSEQKLSFEALEPDENLEITIGKHTLKPNQGGLNTEAGTGYFKTSWNGEEITDDMGKIEVNKPSKGVAWGGVYWQYFEQLDKITTAETPLKLSKKLFKVTNTDKGVVIVPIEAGHTLKVGDLVRVRVELRVDREMEYIHMKDMRAAGFEPINVISSYKWQDGLGYYESTRDAATNFFMGNLPKGTYVFEYDLRANNAGDFSNGITTIQCMYAPEFSSHSEGIRVNIGE